MAALLVGVLAGVLLIRLGRSCGIDNPRCGTFNERAFRRLLPIPPAGVVTTA
jgi:hypothetical protein